MMKKEILSWRDWWGYDDDATALDFIAIHNNYINLLFEAIELLFSTCDRPHKKFRSRGGVLAASAR